MTIHASSNTPLTSFVPVTKADVNLPAGVCRGLWVGVAGTANLMQDDGQVRTNFPLKEGVFPCAVRQVRLGGSADEIWALY